MEQVKATEGFRELVKEPDLLIEILMKTTMPRDGDEGRSWRWGVWGRRSWRGRNKTAR